MKNTEETGTASGFACRAAGLPKRHKRPLCPGGWSEPGGRWEVGEAGKAKAVLGGSLLTAPGAAPQRQNSRALLQEKERSAGLIYVFMPLSAYGET